MGIERRTEARMRTGAAPRALFYAQRFSERQRVWGLRIGIVFLGVLWLFLMAAAWTQDAEADDIDASPQSSDEYNFKWLDPEKKIYVLQNRRYQKAGHALVSVSGGPGFGGNAYRNTWSVTPRLNYFISEQWGIEVFYAKTFNSPNNTYLALQNTGASAFPIIREINNEYGAVVYWAPWYAKINVFNQILYFDWLFGVGGAGMQSTLTYIQTSGTTVSTDNRAELIATTGQQFYLSQRFVIRWDLTGAYYSAPLYGLSGSNVLFSDFRFELGLGVRL